MHEKSKARRKPKLIIGATDHARLSTLAVQAAGRLPEVADELLFELDRAHIAPDGSVPEIVVQMGSSVTFKPDTGDARTVTLVFPGEADIAEGKVSILTPIGVALLGLSSGQAMTWAARDGRRHELVVLDVRRPQPAGAADLRRKEIASHSASSSA
ncbi:MAG: nucleoside diphosphate kinase regulator [Pseudaminobacter sp.]|nr:nucleoside diphosphate kinase regulator [Pseudaminobacter sp.]